MAAKWAKIIQIFNTGHFSDICFKNYVHAKLNTKNSFEYVMYTTQNLLAIVRVFFMNVILLS